MSSKSSKAQQTIHKPSSDLKQKHETIQGANYKILVSGQNGHRPYRRFCHDILSWQDLSGSILMICWFMCSSKLHGSEEWFCFAVSKRSIGIEWVSCLMSTFCRCSRFPKERNYFTWSLSPSTEPPKRHVLPLQFQSAIVWFANKGPN